MGQFYNHSKCSRSEKGQLYIVQRFHPDSIRGREQLYQGMKERAQDRQGWSDYQT